MAYQPQPRPRSRHLPTHEVQHREPSQHRPESSYDHQLSSTSWDHSDSAHAHASNSQRGSLAAPELPTPRTMPTGTCDYPHRDSTLTRGSSTDAFFSSAKDFRFEAHTRRTSFRDDADRYTATADYPSRTRSLHHYADDAMTHYAPSPPASVYARSHEANTLRTLNEPYEREHSPYPQGHRHSFGRDRLRVDSSSGHSFASSSRTPPRDLTSSPALAPYPAHTYRRHSQESLQTTRSRLPSLGDHPVGGWQTPAKRALPVDHYSDVDSQTPVVLLRPNTSHGRSTRPAHDSAISASMPHPLVAHHERHMQERYDPVVRPVATSASHALPHVAAGTASPAAQSSDVSLAPQHPLQPHRKRLRVSRACDECRRRKTRCDIVGAFPGEPGHPLTLSGAVPPLEPNTEPKGEMLILQPCMNCRRSGVCCSYTKRPLKRGPSKGYIKDLERRLNSLESQIVSGDRADSSTEDSANEKAPVQASGAPHAAKPKLRTEDRISRLETVLSRPSTAKSEESKPTAVCSSPSPIEAAVISPGVEHDVDMVSGAAAHHATDNESVISASAFSSASTSSATSASSVSPREVAAPLPPSSQLKSSVFKGKGKAKIPASPSHGSDVDIADVKSNVVASDLHATFPVVSPRSIGEASQSGGNGSNVARLEDRLLAKGLELLAEPVEMAIAHHDTQALNSPAHAYRVASLIGQASAGLGGGLRDELTQQARNGPDGLKALRQVNHRLAGQEADLLMLCHLDHLRNGRSNNSALAAAVTKLGSGSHDRMDSETYRRRTLLFMLDRWHAVGFGTPHLLTNRFAMDRRSFRSMKEALGNASQSSLGDAAHEVLRCAIILGDLNDLAQNTGGWESVSKTDVDAIILSAMEDDEESSSAAREASSSKATPDVDDVTSTAALRHSLESLVRCHHALQTLPRAQDANMEDLRRMFKLAESVLVLGSEKTPVSLQGKLIQSAIGPHALSVAAVALSWCLRIIGMLMASSLPAASSPVTDDASPVSISATSSPLEFYRRQTLNHVETCARLCLFAGGPPTASASFSPVYLRLAAYLSSTASSASQIGSLVSTQFTEDPTALAYQADDLLEMAKEMGALGYVLASTTQGDAWRLLAGESSTARYPAPV